MNISILSAFIFVAVLAGAIFIHEFGHFIVARLLKVEVEEFGFGLPPRILTLFHFKGTEFTLNWLPIGGFVRPKGENDPNVPGGLAAASPWTRLAVLLAGPSMNLLLGIVVFSLFYFQTGVPDYTKVQINEVVAASPAEQAGLKVNDVIVTANGVAIHDFTQLHNLIYASLDKPIQFSLRRGSETVNITATPSSKPPQGQPALGISMGFPSLVRSGSVIESLQYGSLTVYEQARVLVLLPAQLIRGSAPQGARLSGFKGIYDLFNVFVASDVQSRETISSSPSTTPAGSQAPTYVTLMLIGGLTVSLGVLNLFPFPALDGGRILFIWPELILRRRVPAQWENGIHAAGMALLLLFMLYVNVMDFVNPVINSLPK
jgi:regulator of sigma E protease